MKSVYILMLMLAITTGCRSKSNENFQMDVITTKNIVKMVSNNDLEGVKEALKAGADVDATDQGKQSLLLIATKNKLIDMAELLVKYGADVNQQSDNQDSPFLYAGASGQTELVKLFLDNGARFDVFNRYNGTALIPACERGHVETVRLLANTTDYPIDHVNRLGWTALMEAVILGDGSAPYQQIVQILRDAGATLDIPDRDKTTPLQHAKNKGYMKIAELLM